jgi:hypothetical protein
MTVDPSYVLKALLNKTIRDVIDGGMWPKGDCFWLQGLHTEQASHLNMIKNAHTSSNVNSLTWTAKKGFTTALTKYLDLNYKDSQSVNYKLFTDFSCIMMTYTKPGSSKSQLSGGSTATGLVNYGTSARWYHNASTYANYSYAIEEDSVIGINVGGGTSQRYGYWNGAYIGAFNLTNIASNDSLYKALNNCTLIGSKAIWFGGSLTPAQHLLMSNILKYFYANVGGTF